MQLEAWFANGLAQYAADQLEGGHLDVYDKGTKHLARCPFADGAFLLPQDGAITARPFPPAIALRDGVPERFEAIDASGSKVLSGSAGFMGDDPPPEMKFRTRCIVAGADVMIDSFIFSVCRKTDPETTA